MRSNQMPVRLIRLEIGSMYNQSLSIDGEIVLLQNASMEHWFRLCRERFKDMFILHWSRLLATFGTVLPYQQEAFKVIRVEIVVYEIVLRLSVLLFICFRCRK